MPLQVTPVNRNLQTRVTFMLLELEDLFIVLGFMPLVGSGLAFLSVSAIWKLVQAMAG